MKVVPLIFFSCVLALYTLTLYPSLPPGDSGWLIFAPATQGLSHPPGFPLYNFLGYLFSLIPWQNPGWRLNFFSAVCSAAASALMLRTLVPVGGLTGALLAAGVFALAATTWQIATAAEVFALNLLLCALLYNQFHYFLLAHSPQTKFRRLAVFILICGLGASNQHTLALFALPWLVLMLFLFPWRKMRWGYPFALAAVFAAGLLPYVYLVLVARGIPFVNWGDPAHLSGFLGYFFRGDAGTFNLTQNHWQGEPSFFASLRLYFSSFFGDSLGLFYVGLASAAAGVVLLRKRAEVFVLSGLLVAWAFYLIVFCALQNIPPSHALFSTILAKFWPQANLAVCLLIGWSFPQTLNRTRWRLPALLTVLAILGYRVVDGITKNDNSKNFRYEIFGKALLAAAPQNSVFIVAHDLNINAARYAQIILHERPDVKIIPFNQMTYSWSETWIRKYFPEIHLPGTHYHPSQPGSYRLGDFLNANRHLQITAAPLFEGFNLAWNGAGDYVELPFGMIRRAVHKTAMPGFDVYYRESERQFHDFPIALYRDFPEQSWESQIARQYRQNRAMQVQVLRSLAGEKPTTEQLRQMRDIVGELRP